jgi:hypothetical protein
MKKSIVMFGLVLSMVSTVLYRTPSISGKVSEMTAGPVSRERIWDYLESQPILISMPAELPASIRDPLLLAGWVYLYNQERKFELWDGSLLSGRMLAQYVLDHNVSILWGSPDICHGISCSPKPVCAEESCDALDLQLGPIYITASLKKISDGEITKLVDQMAHEIFHYTEPFGWVSDTLFEEYWAFYVGAQVSQSTWADFESYNSRNLACLKLWFMQHRLTVYFGLDPYPQSMIDTVNLNTVNCPVKIKSMTSVYQIISNGQ